MDTCPALSPARTGEESSGEMMEKFILPSSNVVDCDKITGIVNDTGTGWIVVSTREKLFYFDAGNGKWREVGTGHNQEVVPCRTPENGTVWWDSQWAQKKIA